MKNKTTKFTNIAAKNMKAYKSINRMLTCNCRHSLIEQNFRNSNIPETTPYLFPKAFSNTKLLFENNYFRLAILPSGFTGKYNFDDDAKWNHV